MAMEVAEAVGDHEEVEAVMGPQLVLVWAAVMEAVVGAADMEDMDHLNLSMVLGHHRQVMGHQVMAEDMGLMVVVHLLLAAAEVEVMEQVVEEEVNIF